ncbi:MAG: hypothetical protein JW739_04150 [Opitutales bacterium]|nr:hypothetical protein [Opitutales bacterium]
MSETKIQWSCLIKGLYIPLGVLSVLDLIMLWGWRSSSELSSLQMSATRLLLYGFIVTELLQWICSGKFWSYIRSNFLELFFAFFALALIVLERFFAAEIESVWHPAHMGTVLLVYMSVAMFAGLGVFFLRSVLPHLSLLSRKLSPERLFIAGFLFLICLGTLLLKLPNATTVGITWIDAFFTATSAVCVTGLTVVDTATQFTPFGHLVLLILMQVGGLGIMTLTYVIAVVLSREMSMREQIILSDYLNEDNYSRIRSLLRQIVFTVFLFELLGAVGLFCSLPATSGSFFERLFLSIFHSVSAFCNAGFSVYPNGLSTPDVATNMPLQGVVMVLIIVGGLGFFVLRELGLHFRQMFSRNHVRLRWTLHTRLVLWTSLLLTVGGAFLIQMSDFFAGNQLSLLQALFQSISARTAGFNTVDIASLAHGSVIVLIMLMFIGGSPGGTAGGIKTTVAAVAVLNLGNYLRGREHVQLFNRRLSSENSRRAFSVITLSLAAAFSVWFLLALTHPALNALDLFFETISAFSTVGLTRNLTPELNPFGRCLIILTMFVGRIGILYFATAVFSSSDSREILCAKEHIQLG